MHTKVIVTLALGFLMGIGFVSCASIESDADRSLANDRGSHFSKVDAAADKIECNPGEERNESGDCERPHEFERPFHRGGR